MAVSGGAFIPPLIGQVSDLMNISAGLYVLLACAIYLIGLSFYATKKNNLI
jgi:fucose permease